MGTAFWVGRFATVLSGAFAVIFVAQALRGHAWLLAAADAAFWSVVSAAVFVTARFFQSRRGQHCAICKDTPPPDGARGPRRAHSDDQSIRP